MTKFAQLGLIKSAMITVSRFVKPGQQNYTKITRLPRAIKMDMTQDELQQLMSDSAQNAVETTRQEFNIELDGSVASIQAVDTVILAWLERYKDQALEDQAVFTICNIYGAYVGEIFRQHVGGVWRYDSVNPDAPYVVLEYAGHSYAFAGICYQRLVTDSNISVQRYFEQALQNNTQ